MNIENLDKIRNWLFINSNKYNKNKRIELKNLCFDIIFPYYEPYMLLNEYISLIKKDNIKSNNLLLTDIIEIETNIFYTDLYRIDLLFDTIIKVYQFNGILFNELIESLNKNKNGDYNALLDEIDEWLNIDNRKNEIFKNDIAKNVYDLIFIKHLIPKDIKELINNYLKYDDKRILINQEVLKNYTSIEIKDNIELLIKYGKEFLYNIREILINDIFTLANNIKDINNKIIFLSLFNFNDIYDYIIKRLNKKEKELFFNYIIINNDINDFFLTTLEYKGNGLINIIIELLENNIQFYKIILSKDMFYSLFIEKIDNKMNQKYFELFIKELDFTGLTNVINRVIKLGNHDGINHNIIILTKLLIERYKTENKSSFLIPFNTIVNSQILIINNIVDKSQEFNNFSKKYINFILDINSKIIDNYNIITKQIIYKNSFFGIFFKSK